MVELRRSTRQATNSSPSSSQGNTASTNGGAASKRKAESASGTKAKRGRPRAEKQQKTIEQTMPEVGTEGGKDVEMNEVNNAIVKESAKSEDSAAHKQPTVKEEEEETEEKKPAPESSDMPDAKNVIPSNSPSNGETRKAQDDRKANGNPKFSDMDNTGKVEPSKDAMSDESTTAGTKDDAVETSSQREASTPSSILEKGLIYFFFRGRVGIDDPSSVDDIARSYIVLRPLPHGARLGDGRIAESGNNRLLALPKKVLPVSHRDRFMIFVDATRSSMEDIKNKHLTSSDYMTKTAGSRHTPAATPIAEGVYAITTTGRESHLAYILTIPSKLCEVQKDVGLRDRGSFVTSVKNPQYPGPANASLPKSPEYPKELLDEFRSLRWMPLQPKFLDYEYAQFLLIGEGIGELGKATEQQTDDEKNNKDTPLEEMEKLEHEDEIRVEHLRGDDSVFEDLGLSSKEYSQIPTTW